MKETEHFLRFPARAEAFGAEPLEQKHEAEEQRGRRGEEDEGNGTSACKQKQSTKMMYEHEARERDSSKFPCIYG